MYEFQDNFIQPENENIKIWRYMDFTKLVSLIDTRQLYFTRSDKFDDRFEGSLPRRNVEARKIIPNYIPDELKYVYENLMNSSIDINKNWKRYMAVNCWHANEYESAAMWKLYLKSDEGIAIQSTFRKFKDSIEDKRAVYISEVNYIDYETDMINEGNVFDPFLHKRKSFEYEKEIRGLVWILPPTGNKGLDWSTDVMDNGMKIDVNISTLIEKIYIAPNASNWFAELVENIVKKYGLNFEIVQSQLNKDPLF